MFFSFEISCNCPAFSLPCLVNGLCKDAGDASALRAVKVLYGLIQKMKLLMLSPFWNIRKNTVATTCCLCN